MWVISLVAFWTVHFMREHVATNAAVGPWTFCQLTPSTIMLTFVLCTASSKSSGFIQRFQTFMDQSPMTCVCAAHAGSARPLLDPSAKSSAKSTFWPPPPPGGAKAAAAARR